MDSANPSHLARLLERQVFRFERLTLSGIDNAAVLDINAPHMADEETCLFSRDVSCGDDYLALLHAEVKGALTKRKALPVVRFADGEYAFYDYSLHCNGLYLQAESAEAIQQAMPVHIEALKKLAGSGYLAPLVFPGNIVSKKKGFLSRFRRSNREASASTFLDFLLRNHVELKGTNYVPFYVVYAYLASERFARLVDGKTLCVINSECNIESCRRWFAEFSIYPEIVFTEIPDSYVATRWNSIREDVCARIPSHVDICLVGAGVGALLVCVDVAGGFAVPAIDAGHVLNMMNGREDKSKGPRLYTTRRIPA